MVIAKRYLISGRVQGVGYRFFAEREANRLSIRGYVKNLPNGDVEAYAIGTENALSEFKRRLKEGPRGAYVTRVEETEQPIDRDYDQFVIAT